MRAPREHGTLFSAPMVRAVLAEVEPKTQTRRILTRANSVLDYDGGPLVKWRGLDFLGRIHPHYPWAFPSDAKPSCEGAPEGVVSLCAYASDLPTYKPGERTCHRIYPRVRPGDRLWVRETWGAPDADHPQAADGRKPTQGDRIVYRADPASADQWQPGHPGCGDFVWRPSLLMPRWASRITLEVTDVRVERVQDISDADIRAEGVTVEAVRELLGRDFVSEPLTSVFETVTPVEDLSPRDLWRIGWTAINGVESWDANVWLWCYSFRRVA